MKEPGLYGYLEILKKKHLEKIREKGRIELEKSVYCFIVPDFQQILKKGECFFCQTLQACIYGTKC